jgi:hypothetical protein
MDEHQHKKTAWLRKLRVSFVDRARPARATTSSSDAAPQAAAHKI